MRTACLLRCRTEVRRSVNLNAGSSALLEASASRLPLSQRLSFRISSCACVTQAPWASSSSRPIPGALEERQGGWQGAWDAEHLLAFCPSAIRAAGITPTSENR